ncbi:putative pre-16S rRNA nuclease [Drosera capensis]
MRVIICNVPYIYDVNLFGPLSYDFVYVASVEDNWIIAFIDKLMLSTDVMMKYVKPLSLFQDLVKTRALEKGRLLGLDVGNKYVGLAVSNDTNKIAAPLSVLVRTKTNIDLMVSDLQCLISELSLVGFIVGLPFDRQRSTPDSLQIKVFVDDLRKSGKLGGVKYTYWDECFTSKNVELLLKPLKLHPVEAKTIVDKFAAVGILQGYLDYVNRKEWKPADS